MFESSIINKLASDSTLTGLLSTYNGAASIFSDEAPEDAALPYIVIRIDGSTPEGPMQPFNMYVDYFDNMKSRKNSRLAAQHIEYGLDEMRLTHDRYIDLWITLFSGPTPIENEDVRQIDMNLQFTVRANRSKWMQTTK